MWVIFGMVLLLILSCTAAVAFYFHRRQRRAVYDEEHTLSSLASNYTTTEQGSATESSLTLDSDVTVVNSTNGNSPQMNIALRNLVRDPVSGMLEVQDDVDPWLYWQTSSSNVSQVDSEATLEDVEVTTATTTTLRVVTPTLAISPSTTLPTALPTPPSTPTTSETCDGPIVATNTTLAAIIACTADTAVATCGDSVTPAQPAVYEITRTASIKSTTVPTTAATSAAGTVALITTIPTPYTAGTTVSPVAASDLTTSTAGSTTASITICRIVPTLAVITPASIPALDASNSFIVAITAASISKNTPSEACSADTIVEHINITPDHIATITAPSTEACAAETIPENTNITSADADIITGASVSAATPLDGCADDAIVGNTNIASSPVAPIFATPTSTANSTEACAVDIFVANTKTTFGHVSPIATSSIQPIAPPEDSAVSVITANANIAPVPIPKIAATVEAINFEFTKNSNPVTSSVKEITGLIEAPTNLTTAPVATTITAASTDTFGTTSPNNLAIDTITIPPPVYGSVLNNSADGTLAIGGIATRTKQHNMRAFSNATIASDMKAVSNINGFFIGASPLLVRAAKAAGAAKHTLRPLRLSRVPKDWKKALRRVRKRSTDMPVASTRAN